MGDLLVFQPARNDVVIALSMVQWLKLFIKSVEVGAATKSYAEGIFYVQPYRGEHDATYGRIAFGHRVKLQEFEKNYFAGGINITQAHRLLHDDLQEATTTAYAVLGE